MILTVGGIKGGSGKTTLAKTILQIEKAHSGTIKYKGEDITQLSKKFDFECQHIL